MPLRKISLNDARLYLILDREVNSYDELFEIAKKAIAAGVDIIQLRDKRGSAKEILKFSKDILEVTKAKIPYMINDRVDLAVMSCSSGVHLGQDDMPIAEARKMMGENALIGISCQTFEHAQKAESDGADYIGFGSVFKTFTKPDRKPLDLELLKKVFKDIKIPIFAIGGIDSTNVIQLKNLGVDCVAVCRAICKAENVQEAIQQFKEIIN